MVDFGIFIFQILPGYGGRLPPDLRQGSLSHDLSAMDARAGPHINHVICRRHDVRIMLNDNDRIALVPQGLQNTDDSLCVLWGLARPKYR